MGKEAHNIEGNERRIGGRNDIFYFRDQGGGILNRKLGSEIDMELKPSVQEFGQVVSG